MNVASEEHSQSSAALHHVHEVIRSAEIELTGLLRQRDDVMHRIGTIRRLLAAVTELVGESVVEPELRSLLCRKVPRAARGFTSACTKILIRSQDPLSVRSFCDDLRNNFPDIAARHKDLAASVRTVLGRLVASGEVRRLSTDGGVRTWVWVGRRKEHPPDIPISDTALQTTQELFREP